MDGAFLFGSWCPWSPGGRAKRSSRLLTLPAVLPRRTEGRRVAYESVRLKENGMRPVVPSIQCPKCRGEGSQKGWFFRHTCRECYGQGILLQCPECGGEGSRKGWF